MWHWCAPIAQSTSCGDVTCQQCTVTVEPCQSTQGGLAQQAGTNYTRKASGTSSCFDPTLSSLTVMRTLTCDRVLCVHVCSRAKGSGTGGVSCRERLGWHELELQVLHTLYMTEVEKCHVPSILFASFHHPGTAKSSSTTQAILCYLFLHEESRFEATNSMDMQCRNQLYCFEKHFRTLYFISV